MKYAPFGGHTGLRVSQLALGTAMFGTRWGYGSDVDACRAMYESYLGAGGNFIDLADSYQFGEAEELIGSFAEDERDGLVISTKYTETDQPDGGPLRTGNSRKAMTRSVERSLKRLKTDRIDLLWVHMPDGATPIEEIVRGFDDLARSGKILYAGLSNFPAWRTARAVTLSEVRGTLPIAGVQFEYSLVERTPDREILPMARALDLGMTAWSPLGGGVLSGKYRNGGKGGRREGMHGGLFRDEDQNRPIILDEVMSIAEELGTTPARVSIAWIVAAGVVPIVGSRAPVQLTDVLASTDVVLSPTEIRRLDAASAVPLGSPHEMLAGEFVRNSTSGGKAASIVLGKRDIA